MFVPNQKGSPSLINFRSAVKYIITSYIKLKNNELESENKLDYPIINIVGIPSTKTIGELFDNVEKINSLTLRFYPLNGDKDYTGAFDALTREIREDVGSKHGEIVYKSPKSISGVKRLLEKAAGTINPIIKVTTKNKSKATLKDDELTEVYPIDMDDDSDVYNEGEQLAKKMTKIQSMRFTNEQHNEIYNTNKNKVISIYNKKR